MYTISITAKAKKQLRQIPERYKHSVKQAIEELKESPFSGKPLTRELTGLYSYKVGVFRILYTVNKKDNIVSIINTGPRSIIYQ